MLKNFLWSTCLSYFTMCLSNSFSAGCPRTGEVEPIMTDLHVGSSLNIKCCHPNKVSRPCTGFISTTLEGTVAPIQKTESFDQNIIILMIQNATGGIHKYTCMCGSFAVRSSYVFVGTPPKNITDFKCVVRGFNNMVCNFTVPESTVFTDFYLTYAIGSQTQHCTLIGTTNGKRCEINNSNYRSNQQTYNFTLSSNSTLGRQTQLIQIDQFSRVENITEDGATLCWTVPSDDLYHNFTNGLHFDIRFISDTQASFTSDASIQHNNGKYWVVISRLQYSSWYYNFTLRAKTGNNAVDNDNLWSEPFEGSFKTKPRIPDRPPIIDVGSFYIDPHKKQITLYWQQLFDFEENGPNFSYWVKEIKGNGQQQYHPKIWNVSTPSLVTSDWQNTSHYIFEVRSQNQMGQSLNKSILEISPRNKNLIHDQQSQSITKLYHSKNQTYSISWIQPKNNISSFTLFWCEAKTGFNNQCMGSLMSTTIAKNIVHYFTEPQNVTLNYALSENYKDISYSSGMMWAMCIPDAEVRLSKVLIESQISSHENITLRWITQCWYAAFLEGYILTYCIVENNITQKCTDAERRVHFCATDSKATIYNLKPSSLYKISIRMYSQKQIGPLGNAVFQSTADHESIPKNILWICFFGSFCALAFIIIILKFLQFAEERKRKRCISCVLPNELHLSDSKNYNETSKTIEVLGRSNTNDKEDLYKFHQYDKGYTRPTANVKPSGFNKSSGHIKPNGCVELINQLSDFGNPNKDVLSRNYTETSISNEYKPCLNEPLNMEQVKMACSNGYVSPQNIYQVKLACGNGYVNPHQMNVACANESLHHQNIQQLSSTTNGYTSMQEPTTTSEIRALGQTNVPLVSIKSTSVTISPMNKFHANKARYLNNWSGYIKNNPISDKIS